MPVADAQQWIEQAKERQSHCVSLPFPLHFRRLAELAKGKVLQESYVGKYRLYANKPLLKLLKQ